MRLTEQGFLLLTSHLGNPDRRPLTPPQLRLLTKRMAQMPKPEEDGALEPKHLIALGLDWDLSERIVALLEETELLEWYMQRARRLGCVPITRSHPRYPARLRRRLGPESPGCLWAKGDLSLLDAPSAALVGSRDLNLRNREFAAQAGTQAARQGFALVSGNARGADTVGQNACLAAGGQVICVIADELHTKCEQPGILYISEEDYDAPFSAQRALHRNRVIHALGEVTIAAQCNYKKGGTWDGATTNLRYGFTPLCCFRDGSQASLELEQMGAQLISMDELSDLGALSRTGSFFENILHEDF